jgi:hypothetical protein
MYQPLEKKAAKPSSLKNTKSTNTKDIKKIHFQIL